ncbi:hypothetical protein J2T58_002261 [Methanocalculus alkaliphilus]|uniref:hypothetical protein n=1 Tax=Methanocalculus alkaliphilus TaxID=768730 RepID=UPI0020A08884|nr:hypothetical protein [Methanocalculus alkaliphilus]MCP1716380.1 hypothetical protein [Methanocalculus alkaliphilus]
MERGYSKFSGIVVNEKKIESEISDITRKTNSDSEIIALLLQKEISTNKSLLHSIQRIFSMIHGEASIGFLFTDYNVLTLATNTGSIYCLKNNDIFLFASERFIVSELCKNKKFKGFLKSEDIFQLKPSQGCLIDIQYANFTIFNVSKSSNDRNVYTIVDPLSNQRASIIDHSDYNNDKKTSISNYDIGDRENIRRMIIENYQPNMDLRRCTKCILPETFPYIDFDDRGVCNYCRDYSPIQLKGSEALLDLVKENKRGDGKQDCIIGFSGGRDSSYVLHYARKKLGVNPIAFTYDWGMVTDIARRNCARVCGALEVEHIVVSADLEKKRRNVRLNLNAWLKKPDLGILPLLMAGDKQFYYFAHKIREDTGISFVLGGANPYERTDFKLGFCGISPDDTRGKGLLTGIKFSNKVKLLLYYVRHYLFNPAYINASIFDTFHAFYSTYVLKDAYINIYDYIPWNEEEVVSLLRTTYDWEIAPDTTTTWRIGDGKADFYNYVYYNVAGFSEIDTFRSNQVRAGAITREEALKLAEDENKPRSASLEWYAETIRFNLEDALNTVNGGVEMHKSGGLKVLTC